MPNSELLILNKTDEKTKQNENNANWSFLLQNNVE
jgi:hypothetical protein